MRFILCLFTLLCSLSSFALSIPSLNQPIMDQISLLDSETKSSLDGQIRAVYNDKKGPQLTVLIISTLEGNAVEDVAHKVFTTWKLGDAKRDDGVLFIVAINDRKMRIEVGQGLEGSLTDFTSKQILNQVKPHFKNKDYAQGIKAGVQGILEVIGKTDAVQMPVSETPVQEAKPEVPERVATPQEIQAQKDLFGMILAVLVTVLVLGLSVNRIFRAYSNRKNDYTESVRDLNFQLEKDRELKFKSKVTDLAKASKEMDKQSAEFKAKETSLRNSIEEEESKKSSSPKSQLESKLSDVRYNQGQEDYLQSQINHYKQVIKENR